jgi:hypothetical protein
MAASHYAYDVLKMPGPISVIAVPCDKKDALICADKIYREAAAAAAVKALAAEAPGGKNKKKFGKSSCAHSGKRTSSECYAAVEDAPESSTGKCKKNKATPPATKKVPAKEDGTGGSFTISATLDAK